MDWNYCQIVIKPDYEWVAEICLFRYKGQLPKEEICGLNLDSEAMSCIQMGEDFNSQELIETVLKKHKIEFEWLQPKTLIIE